MKDVMPSTVFGNREYPLYFCSSPSRIPMLRSVSQAFGGTSWTGAFRTIPRIGALRSGCNVKDPIYGRPHSRIFFSFSVSAENGDEASDDAWIAIGELATLPP